MLPSHHSLPRCLALLAGGLALVAARGRNPSFGAQRVWQEAAARRMASDRGGARCAAPEDCGAPLNVSPMLARGDVASARQAAAVSGLGSQLDGSFSALVTSDAARNDSMWFWWLPPQSERGRPAASHAAAPTVVWLQGGPGAPSTYGFFSEIGPVVVQADGSLRDRAEAWNKRFALLVIDNPSGVGFSPLGDTARPVQDEEMVGRQLTEVLRQWTLMFPERRHLDLFIAGESYGGKYGPSAAAAVHRYNLAVAEGPGPAGGPQVPINLRGLIIADGWCDPATHAAGYAAMMYGQALLDDVQRLEVDARMQRSIALLRQGNLTAAFDGWNSVWGDYGGDYPGKSFEGPCLFDNYTGGRNTENIWFSGSDPNIPNFAYAYAFLDRAATRRALHIGNLSMSQVDQYAVMVASGDVMNSSRPAIETVLQAGKYNVLAYNGAWDGVVGSAVSEPLYAGLEWPGAAHFRAGARQPYKVAANDTQVAGFVRSVRSNGTRFVRVVVRRAGHILPADEPAVARDMVERFVFDKEFV